MDGVAPEVVDTTKEVETTTPPAVVETPVSTTETPVSTTEAKAPTTPATTTPTTPTETPKPTDWRDRRIAQLTAQLAEARKAPVVTSGVTTPNVDIDRLANERAGQIAALTRFNEQCMDTAMKGRAAFPDFDNRIAELRKLQDPNDQASIAAYNGFLAVAIETGEGEKILHALGSDLNEAARIMSLSPARMGIEMARMVGSDGQVISRVPKPITPIGSRSQQHIEVDPRDPGRSDNLSTAEWMRRREAQMNGSTKH